jgi:multiple sugar transport system substrate-binding protein
MSTWPARFMAVACAAALLSFSGALPRAVAAPSHSTVTLTLWSGLSGPDQTGFKKIVSGFNKSQKAVKINYDQQSSTGYTTKLSTALSAGQGPNIWTLDAADSVTYIHQGQQAAVDKYIKGTILTAKNFDPTLYKQYASGGHQYMIPLDVTPLVMYYNKKLLSKAGLKAPVTGPSSKVISTAKKLTKGSNQYGLVIPTDWPMQYLWPTVLAQFGGKPFNTSTKTSTVNSAAGVKALTALYDLIYKDHTGPTQYAVDQDIKMMANGSAAQIFDGPWESTNASLLTLGKNLGVSKVPQIGPHYKVFVGDTGFAFYKKDSSTQLKAAMKFVEYYETHSLDMAAVGDDPGYEPLLKSSKLKKYKVAYVGAQELKYGVYSVRYFGYVDSYLYDDAIWPVLRGQSTDIKGDLDKAAQDITNHVQQPSA